MTSLQPCGRVLASAVFAGTLAWASVAGAQSARADSARALAARADSAVAQGTAESVQRALGFRVRASELFRESADARNLGLQLNAIGNIHYLLGRLDSARVWYERALPVRLASMDSAGYGRTIHNIANVLADQGQVDSAIVRYREALTIARAVRARADEGGPISGLGLQFYQIGELDSALFYLHQAVAINRETGDREGEAQTLLSIGNILHSRGQQDTSMRVMRAALQIGATIDNRAIRGAALQNIGAIFRAIGEPDSSLANYRAALAENRAAGFAKGEALQLHNIGIVLAQLAQLDSALVYMRAALDVQRRLGDPREEGRVLTGIGIVWQQLHSADSALAYFNAALPLRRSTQDRAGEGRLLANISSALVAAGKGDSAMAVARVSIALARQTGDRHGEGGALGILAHVLERRGMLDSARSTFDANLAIAREIGDLIEAGDALSGLGRVALRSNALAAASSYFDSAAVAKAAVSRRAGSDFNRTSVAERDSDLFDNWMRSWLRRPEGLTSSDVVHATLAASERGRAQALLALMRDSSVLSSRTPTLESEGAALVASAIRGGGGILSYEIVGDSLLVWSAFPGTPARLDVVSIGRGRIASLVTELRRAMGVDDGTLIASRGNEEALSRSGGVAASGDASWRNAASVLSSLVLSPRVRMSLRSVTRVVIVPQGVLALIPFAALPVTANGVVLGDVVSIEYTPSLAIRRSLQASRPLGAPGTASTQAAARDSSLVVGNPMMPAATSSGELRARLSPLPGAEREALTVARMLGGSALTGAIATEAEVRRRMPTAAVIHLATHGLAYSASGHARRSFVALAPGDGHDGLLTVAELLDDPSLALRAHLVVLSACQTGLGTISEAEGTIGLQRALLARGARGVLVSLWNVSDEATGLLMERFYRHWRGSERLSAAQALRRAQQDVRRVPKWAHPRYWAAFQLVGAAGG